MNKKTNCGYEKLEKCVTTAEAETLPRYSSSLIGPVLNGFVNGKSLTTIVAAEIWHRRTCMRHLYAKPSKGTDGFSKERAKVFQCLLQYIQTNVIDNSRLLSLSATLNFYKTLQESYEMEVKDCIVKNLKSRLPNHFNLQIDFPKTSKGIDFYNVSTLSTLSLIASHLKKNFSMKLIKLQKRTGLK